MIKVITKLALAIDGRAVIDFVGGDTYEIELGGALLKGHAFALMKALQEKSIAEFLHSAFANGVSITPLSLVDKAQRQVERRQAEEQHQEVLKSIYKKEVL